MTYSQGDNVALTCTAMGGPGNSFQWFFNEASLSSAMSSSLALMNVSAADGGVYTCMVTNSAGVNNATTYVFIAPYFTTQPQDMGGASGDVVNLMCEAEAFPLPTYQWSRVDGGMLFQQTDTNVLTFNPLNYGDAGNFFCTATSNGNSTQSEVATLSGNTY